MLSKYLKNLDLTEKDTPQYWEPNDKRQEQWKKEREEYGFDSRETWSLDYTFKLWLYERLSMYNEVAPKVIDTSFHKYEFKGEQITFQDCINKMLEGLKIDLTIEDYDRTEEQKQKAFDVIQIFALCFNSLWW